MICQSKGRRDKRQEDLDTDSLLYSASKVMERVATARGITPSDEKHAEVPSSGREPDIECDPAAQLPLEDRTPVCVAYFPHAISHNLLMDKRLVNKPYLVFTFKLKHKHLS